MFLGTRFYFPFPGGYVTLCPAMMKFLRTHTKIIVWIAAIAFIICGGYSISSLKKEGRFAGEVFGKAVTFQEYNKFYRATQLFMPSKEPTKDPDLLRNYTWQNIIYAKEAKREGINVTDQEVRTNIANILQQQGLLNPTPQQYKVWLARTLQMSPRDFEEGLREFIRIQKLLQKKIPAPTKEPGKEKVEPTEEAIKKQRQSFITWTNEVNKKAAFKDYLAIQQFSSEASESAEPQD